MMHWISSLIRIKCWKCNRQLSSYQQVSSLYQLTKHNEKQTVSIRSITTKKYLGNHYETLGIEPNAKPEEIKSAYIKLSKLHHPDKSSEKNSEEFLKIAEAFDVLGSPKRKIEYDMQEFARSANINRFASGEYKRYNEADFQKKTDNSEMNFESYKRRTTQQNSSSDTNLQDGTKLSPRMSQLLSYMYAAIISIGLLLYYLGNHFKISEKENKPKSSSSDDSS